MYFFPRPKLDNFILEWIKDYSEVYLTLLSDPAFVVKPVLSHEGSWVQLP